MQGGNGGDQNGDNSNGANGLDNDDPRKGFVDILEQLEERVDDLEEGWSQMDPNRMIDEVDDIRRELDEVEYQYGSSPQIDSLRERLDDIEERMRGGVAVS